MMEWAISFTPNDLQDLTYAEAARKVNPKIVLNIRIGCVCGPASEDLSWGADGAMQSWTCGRWQGHYRRGSELQGRHEDQAQADGESFLASSAS